jgi:hypothetical protein
MLAPTAEIGQTYAATGAAVIVLVTVCVCALVVTG